MSKQVRVLKNEGDDSKPDMAEVDTRFSAGDRFRILYDWSDDIPGIVGIEKIWHRDEVVVEITEVVCNMVIMPPEVWLFLKTEDPKFVAHYGGGVFGLEESRLERRIVDRA